MLEIQAEPLSARAFAAFGDVIETAEHAARWINAGSCERFDDLARIDVAAHGGRPLISIFRALPRSLPFRIEQLERHPLSSQAFFPLDRRPFLVVVAAGDGTPQATHVRAFLSSGSQGVNYRRNTWHHELLAIGARSEFLVIDRGGPGENCELITVDGSALCISAV
jgi:ureidoglycolate lyase